MKFMKLGSKPDQFQTDGDNIRYVATELATDIIVNVGDVKFYLHKFPLLSKSSRLQKLVADTNREDDDEINIHDIPGGPASFETCAKFCYGMVVTLNAYNIVAARCAAEYLEMYETVEKGNLIHKIDVFLSSCILRSWKDSIIALQTTRSFLPWSEDLKIISHCLDSITAKACTDPSKVDWSYSYNHKKLSSENGKKHDDPSWNGVKKQHTVTKDWWVEDLCELQIDMYKRVITALKAKGRVSNDVIGESLNAYASRRLPIFNKSTMQGVDVTKYRYLVETLVRLMPGEKNSAPCSFLLKLLHASIMLECGENTTSGLTQRIAQQLDEASVADFLIDCQNGEMALYSIDLVQNLVEQFLMREHSDQNDDLINPEFQEMSGELSSDASKTKVARLVDGYLAEASRDPSLPLSKFLDLANLVSGFPRATHDGIYRAVDMYLKEHSEITKSEKKRICRLMDCKKLSPEACAHAVQNERLPLRVVVQVLFFEQARAASNNGSNTPDLSGSMRTVIQGGSFGSSRTGTTTTNTDEDWEGEQATSEDLKGLKRELASLKLRNNECEKLNALDKVAAGKKGTKIFSRLWSGKERRGGESSNSSDTCESPASTGGEEIIRCTPLRKY